MRKLGGPHSRSRHDGNEGNLLLPRKESLAIQHPSPATILAKPSGYSNRRNIRWLLSHKGLDGLHNPSGLPNKKICPCQGSDLCQRAHSTGLNELPECLTSTVARSCQLVRGWVDPRVNLTSVAKRKPSIVACPSNRI